MSSVVINKTAPGRLGPTHAVSFTEVTTDGRARALQSVLKGEPIEGDEGEGLVIEEGIGSDMRGGHCHEKVVTVIEKRSCWRIDGW
ncbi:hypothetical protein EVAR_98020_1 [Eumeta japonica]|uniref:Uncharacterized protein n=1 Tax=Eumeta variegata TaxID=151549 RepID=A0A4C2A874_EUMVA|nr:hypothetical protein EVAR_98020_1 [Eumeta japonica]